VISEVKQQSPADQCGKVEAGDEILQIDGQTVVGWTVNKMMQRITCSQRGLELHLLLKKRPREAIPTLSLRPSQPTTPSVIAKRKSIRLYASVEQQQQQQRIWPKQRRRSNSLTTPKSALRKVVPIRFGLRNRLF
jgi:connector enhancer of kinase suppressor of Ras 2